MIVATYNVLADAYVNPRFYPSTPPALLARGARRERLAERIAALGADVVCLQEVELDVYARLDERLVGYAGDWQRRSASRPDGCAIFVRAPLTIRDGRALVYADGSGHIAQIVHAAAGDDGISVAIATTHLKWDAPGAPAPHAPRQMRELLDALRDEPRAIVCGDLNVDASSETHRMLLAEGFVDPHGDEPTCNANRRAKKIDFLVARGLVGSPLPTPRVEDDTPLPSESEPSDHVPLVADFRA